MKKLIIIIILWAGLTACPPSTDRGSKTTNTVTEHQENVKPKIIVAHALDFSQSTSKLTYFTSDATRRLYTAVSANGGGEVKLFPICSSSDNDIYTMHVGYVDTPSTAGITNVYKAGRLRTKNKKAFTEFQAQMEQEIAAYDNLINRKHDCPYTDLQTCLSLISYALSSPNTQGSVKYLLLCSDMLNDPQYRRHAKLRPVHLANTTVLIVRPSLSIPEKKLLAIFPDCPVYIFTDVNDAINFIQTNAKPQNQKKWNSSK